jgi:RNA polymerase sigma-70 factor (sigma-E family)
VTGGESGAAQEHPSADDDGFVQWASLRRRRLRRTAYLLCADWSAADDLVQESLVRVYRHWRRIASGEPDAYARKVLTSVFIDERRRPWRRETATATVPEEATVDEPSTVSGPLLDALRQVPPRQRAVLVLRFWEDLSVEQTAQLLGCSTGNVKSQSARGLVRLRELLPEQALTYDEETAP